MPITIPNLFLDNDGVLSSFERHVKDLYGFLPSEVHPKELWSKISSNKTFWLDIPVHDGAYGII